MQLPRERVGPWVRALRAAANALAPDEGWVPLAEILAHLDALDPALSGDLLLPAEVMPATGMPSYGWLSRAVAEAAVARSADAALDPSDAELARVRDLDPALGERMARRRALHRHLRSVALLPTTRLYGAVRRKVPSVDLVLRYDRIAPDGRWQRIAFELRSPPGQLPDGLGLSGEDRVRVDEALLHLLTRHFATGLLALRAQLEAATGVEVVHLSRGWLGPFWWPGVTLPEGVDPRLGAGVLLHASREQVGAAIRSSRHVDPLHPPPVESVPEALGVFRERRLACNAALLVPAQQWFEAAGLQGAVVPIAQPRARRL